MPYDHTVRLDADFDTAVSAVREALAGAGLRSSPRSGTMVTLTGLPALETVAEGATARLDAALAALT